MRRVKYRSYILPTLFTSPQVVLLPVVGRRKRFVFLFGYPDVPIRNAL
jgi:hypothetical protein